MKKKIYILTALLGLLLVLFFVANFIIKNKIESYLKNDLPPNISLSYKTVSISLLAGNASIEQVNLLLKDKGINLKFSNLDFKNFHLIKLLFSDTIHIEDCNLKNPKISIDQSQIKIIKDNNKANQKNQIIIVDEFSIENAEMKLKDKLGKKELSFINGNSQIKNILFETNPKKEKKLKYKIENLTSENLFYRIDEEQYLTINKINSESQNLTFENLKIDYIKNNINKFNYIKKGNDLLSLNVKKLQLNPYFYSFDDLISIKSKSVSIVNPEFTIYSHLYSQNVKVEHKPLYSEWLRNLKINLDIDKVVVINGKIVYAEHDQLSNAPGKISFTKLNATVKNFKNKDSINDLIDINATFNFMDTATSKVHWTARIYNPKDEFTFKGYVKNLNINQLNLFTVNTLNAKSEGKINQANFDFKGNNYDATGNMNVEFSDFKILLLKEKTKKERKILNAINNIFTNRKEKEKDKIIKNYTVLRDQNRPFFNFVWLFLKHGLLVKMTAIK
ncbi:MAG: hypothetical protein H7239_15015 [Flavobacterium sp.]|nr:hypothetical protein [Flavobacterium sp.]